MFEFLRSVYRKIVSIIIYDKSPTVEEIAAATYINSLKKNYKSSHDKNKILLVPLINDPANMRMYMKIALRIAEEDDLSIKYFFIHTAVDWTRETSFTNSLLGFIRYRILYGYKRLCRVYNIKEKDVVFSNHFWPGSNKKGLFEKESKESILKIAYKGVLIGDLVYDSYLRFRSRPTIDLKDADFHYILQYAGKLAKRWDRFFKRKSIHHLLLPYTAYLHWGIPARLALTSNIQVTTFGSYIYILKDLKAEYPFHSKNHHLYRQLFEGINDKEAKIKAAQKKLEARFQGEIDEGTIFMKNSAFQNPEPGKPLFNFGDKPFAVIFLHCFFDSPHIYKDGLFPDFYEWIVFLLDEAKKHPAINYFIKSHPNGIEGNEEIILSLKEKYRGCPNISFISGEISNNQVLAARPRAIFTYYGTVAHEFAYNGIPAVNAGDNPHASYGFTYNPASKQELAKFISSVGEFGLPSAYKKEEILEFYYMNYMFFSKTVDQIKYTNTKNFTTGEFYLPSDVPYSDLIF